MSNRLGRTPSGELLENAPDDDSFVLIDLTLACRD
jgi:hypothetical protein